MKLVFVSDSFKGMLSSSHICELLSKAAHEAYTNAECVCLTIADGGEGTLDAIASARRGERVKVGAHDGLMQPIECEVLIDGDAAFVEVAQACNLVALDGATLQSIGLAAVLETAHDLPVEHAISHAEETYLRAARRLFSQ